MGIAEAIELERTRQRCRAARTFRPNHGGARTSLFCIFAFVIIGFFDRFIEVEMPLVLVGV